MTLPSEYLRHVEILPSKDSETRTREPPPYQSTETNNSGPANGKRRNDKTQGRKS